MTLGHSDDDHLSKDGSEASKPRCGSRPRTLPSLPACANYCVRARLCVHACVRARARVGARLCVRACSCVRTCLYLLTQCRRPLNSFFVFSQEMRPRLDAKDGRLTLQAPHAPPRPPAPCTAGSGARACPCASADGLRCTAAQQHVEGDGRRREAAVRGQGRRLVDAGARARHAHTHARARSLPSALHRDARANPLSLREAKVHLYHINRSLNCSYYSRQFFAPLRIS